MPRRRHAAGAPTRRRISAISDGSAGQVAAPPHSGPDRVFTTGRTCGVHLVGEQDDKVLRSHRVLTIPNVISIIRLAGVPLFLWLVLVPEADGWAFAVLAISDVSDYADGYLARRL